MSSSTSIGVYFSANDAVYEWVLAFLSSFRTFNPTLRLILIPFNDQCERLLRLQQLYNFEVWSNPDFAQLEEIGKAFELGLTSTGPYWFRRYAAFWGPLERFMYLDARQLVLADLTPCIEALDVYDFELLHYDCALNQVYAPGPFRRMLLLQGRGRGFNSGRWVARCGLFTLEEFQQLAEDALKIRDQLNPRNTDQAFINYCCDMKPIRYGHLAEVVGNIVQNAWARQPGTIYQERGKYYLWDYGGQDHKKQIILLHWAGQRLNSLMPHRWLFDEYSHQHRNFSARLQLQLKNVVDMAIRLPFERLRRNRLLNQYYHRAKSK